MSPSSTSRNLCVPRLAASLCVFLLYQSLFPASQGHPSAAHLSFQQPFFSPVGCCALLHIPGASPNPLFPQLNLHRARIRRNPSGFLQTAVIESAQSSLLPFYPSSETRFR